MFEMEFPRQEALPTTNGDIADPGPVCRDDRLHPSDLVAATQGRDAVAGGPGMGAVVTDLAGENKLEVRVFVASWEG